MRAKRVWCVKYHLFLPIFLTPLFLTKNRLNFWEFLGHPLSVFWHKKFQQLMIEKKRYSTTNSVQYSGLHKAQSALEKRKTPCTLQWKVHPGPDWPYAQPSTEVDEECVGMANKGKRRGKEAQPTSLKRRKAEDQEGNTWGGGSSYWGSKFLLILIRITKE